MKFMQEEDKHLQDCQEYLLTILVYQGEGFTVTLSVL
jgi:hypothetical protein